MTFTGRTRIPDRWSGSINKVDKDDSKIENKPDVTGQFSLDLFK